MEEWEIVCIFAEKLRVIMEIGTINTIRQYFVTQPIKKAWLFGSCLSKELKRNIDLVEVGCLMPFTEKSLQSDQYS